MQDIPELPKDEDHIVELFSKGRLTPAQAFELMRTAGSSEAGISAKVQQESSDERVGKILNELDQLIGLNGVKKLVKELCAFVEIQKRREKERLLTEPLVLHMMFNGNPGTGKTTVARILGRLFKEMGVIEKGHLIEAERADLVGEYIGHTAQKTREQVRRALGGILFIDEAYSLARGGEKDFGKEAIDTLVKSMEDHRNEFILVLAGYRNEMRTFMETNPGLKSRIPIQIDFPDYTIDELMAIAVKMASERQYRYTLQAEKALRRILQSSLDNDGEIRGNARTVRNIIEKAIRRQAVRLMKSRNITRLDLMTIEKEDFEEVP